MTPFQGLEGSVTLSFLDGTFLKFLALQNIGDITWSELSAFADDQASCVVAIELSRKLREKSSDGISDQLRSRKRKAKDLFFFFLVSFPALLAHPTFRK